MMDIKMKLFNISAYLDIVKARSFLPRSTEEAEGYATQLPCPERAYPRINGVSIGVKSVFLSDFRGRVSIFS
jgi:hypothetical protein